MELIKKIKEAEAHAQQIIERAKADAAGQAEKGRENRHQILTQTERERKKAIETAVAQAESQGLAEVERLKTQAEKNRQQLREKIAGKMPSAIEKVMDYLRG